MLDGEKAPQNNVPWLSLLSSISSQLSIVRREQSRRVGDEGEGQEGEEEEPDELWDTLMDVAWMPKHTASSFSWRTLPRIAQSDNRRESKRTTSNRSRRRGGSGMHCMRLANRSYCRRKLPTNQIGLCCRHYFSSTLKKIEVKKRIYFL
jgi:hypothetical protein